MNWRRIAFVTAVVGALMTLPLLFQWCGHQSDERAKIPPATQRALDSLTATAITFRQQAESLRTVVHRDTLRVRVIQRRVDTLLLSSHTLETLADSLALQHQWQSAFQAERRANDTLHFIVDSLQSAVRTQQDAQQALLHLYAADTLRRVAVERINTSLQDAIARLERPCRILGPVPCPSRTVTFVGTALLAVGIMSR